MSAIESKPFIQRADPGATWGPLTAFALGVAMWVLVVVLGTAVAMIMNLAGTGVPSPVAPIYIEWSALLGPLPVAGLTWFIIRRRPGSAAVLNAPSGRLIPLVVVPLAFAAAALLYYFAKTSLGVPSAAPAGPGLHDGQLTVLAGQMKWVAIASMIVTAPLVEEFILRGLMLPALAASRLGFIGATILTTFLFVIMHTGGLLKFSSVAVLWDWHFLSSLGLCATWYFTRSVWPCVLAHAAMNLAVVLNVLRLLAQGT